MSDSPASTPATATAEVAGGQVASNNDKAATTVFSSTVDALAATTEALSISRHAASNPLLSPEYVSEIAFTHPDFASNIPEKILEALTQDLHFLNPSAVQKMAIPKIKQGKNFIIQSQTGTGKTICFAIAMLSKIDVAIKGVQSLCIAPTRELARQIFKDAIKPLSKRMDSSLSCKLLIPREAGSPAHEDEHGSGPVKAHLIVGTPGTIMGAVQKNLLSLNQLRVFVLDEADHMIGHTGSQGDKLVEHVTFIRNKLTSNPQMLLFSATFTPEALAFAKSILESKGRRDEATGKIEARIISTKKINPNDPNSLPDPLADLPLFQVAINCGTYSSEADTINAKISAVSDILTQFGSSIEKCIIFVKSHMVAETVAGHFSQSYPLSKFHGHMTIKERDDMFRAFCEGDIKFLVATDVLAKGIDVPATSHVINFDVPFDFQAKRGDHIVYTHKIGRCIRFGRFGTAINLLSGEKDFQYYHEIEHTLGYVPSSGKTLSTNWERDQISQLREEYTRRKMEYESKGVADLVESTVTLQG